MQNEEKIITITECSEDVAGSAAETDTGTVQPEKNDRKRKKPRSKALTAVMICLAAVLLAAGGTAAAVTIELNHAHDALSNGEFYQAKKTFEKYDFLPAVSDMPKKCDYYAAKKLMKDGNYILAKCAFEKLDGYLDSEDLATKSLYCAAKGFMDNGKYNAAIALFEQLGDYSDAAMCIDACKALKGIDLYHSGSYSDAVILLDECSDANRIASGYSYLAMTKQNRQSPLFIDTASWLLEGLMEYTDIPEVKESLNDPFFFFERMKNANWEFGEYHIRNYGTDGWLYYTLPFDCPDGGEISRQLSEDGTAMELYLGGSPWFSIVGFSSYDELHPEKMYIADPNGIIYTFELAM